jgi:rhodanese-related sulfurtransferase
MKQIITTTAVVAILALVLPAVVGCKTCEGGACAITASETGKTLSSGCPNGGCKAQPPPVATNAEQGPAVINTETLNTLLAAKSQLVLLDARSGKYDDGRRIPGAKTLNAKSTAKEVAATIKTKETLVVTYCSNLKCPASNMLAKHLVELGYENVLEYSEGIAGWAAAGHEVKTTKK